jgi:hypothetical protein
VCADLHLRLDNVGSHELLQLSQILQGDVHFDGISLAVIKPIGCENRHAALMAAFLVLLSSLRTCLRLDVINVTFQVASQEAMQSATAYIAPLPSVVLTVRSSSYVAHAGFVAPCC